MTMADEAISNLTTVSLALVLNGLDPAFGYESWRRLLFPDFYRLTFEGKWVIDVNRLWDAAQKGATRHDCGFHPRLEAKIVPFRHS